MIEKIYNYVRRMCSPAGQRDTYSSGYWQSLIRQEVLCLTRQRGGRILEVGCGEGLLLDALAQQNPGVSIYGIDNSRERITQTARRMKDAALPGVLLSLQDGAQLACRDNCFDAVICINVLFNQTGFAQARQILSEMKRVCKESGVIIFDVRNSRNPLVRLKYKLAQYYDPTVSRIHLQTFDPAEIEAALERLHLRIVKKICRGFFIKRYAPIVIIQAEKCSGKSQ